MNVLNKGRCSRCIASKKEPKEIKKDNKLTIFSAWLKCAVNKNWCRNCALNCKEPPMGISAEDYKKYNGKG
jgi:hypothetical protein